MAAQAMEDRANGDFDDWKEKNFEEFWGQKAKAPVMTAYQAGTSTNITDGITVARNEASSSARIIRSIEVGEADDSTSTPATSGTNKGRVTGASSIRFRQMVREQCFRVGDLWKYSVNFKAGDLLDRSFSHMAPDASVVVEKWVQVSCFNT